MKRIFGVFAGSLVVAIFLAACAMVPETGRRQVMLVSPGQEMQLGLTSFQQMKTELPLSKDATANAMLQRVGKRIAAVAPLTNAQWEFVLFESKEPNAFCLPGGKVGVYTGILPITENEAGLATVIGHEVAHAVARHGAERMSRSLVLQGVGSALGAAITDPRYQQAFALGYGATTQVGLELPHSRNQESEADELGLYYMARSGYNPQEAVRFWQRFKAFAERSGGGSGPAFLRTHPTDEQRISDIQQKMPKAMSEYQRSGAR